MPGKTKKSSFFTFPIILILGLASFLRFYRINEILGFWYDQGRDALVIWDMIHSGKFTLIGPMMGFTGMFRGAWYYWLITPFYALGGGSPIWPSVFLIATSVIAVYILYRVGKSLGGEKTGIISALIASVSMYVVGASRWLSDPTPTLLTSILLIWALYKFLDKKIWALPLAGFLAGMSLQFSAATEIYYVPAIIIILLLKRKSLPNFKIIIFSIFSFFVAFIPQAVFELRHPGVQLGALFNFVFHEKTFTFAFWEILKTRLPFYYNLFASKFWTNGGMLFAPFFIIFIGTLIINWKKFWKNDMFKIVFVLSLSPFIGTLFFISNLGGLYEYYFTGYYLIWILLFSYVLAFYSAKIWGKFIISVFIAILFFQNFFGFKNYYLVKTEDLEMVTFRNEISVIDWIYKDAKGQDFNVDVYVPPVIPYAYEYLFKWYGVSKYGYAPAGSNIPLLYTLEESDTEHPERIQAWYDRQKGIAKIQEVQKFGIITVERRTRISGK